MPQMFGYDLTPEELRERVGSMSQVAGIERLEFTEGPERGVELLRVRTGGGLTYDVLPGRGMDIAHASYDGIPLAWMSGQGIPHAHFFEPAGLGWLRSFFGGLVSTCGLLNAGSPGADPDHEIIYAGIGTEDTAQVKLGLHGRVNNTPARNVAVSTLWEDDDYLLAVYGCVREAIVFGEQIEMERRILSVAGGNVIQIHDEVTNHGFDSMPHMMLYHINLGWPIVSADSTLVTSGEAAGVTARDEIAAPGLPQCYGFEEPRASFPEQVFYHALEPDEEGYCQAAIINHTLLDGLGVGITWSHDTLPNLVQWKSMKRGTYVCGLEPSNCKVTGRADERAAGTLRYLEPGETITYDVLLTVLDGPDDCEAFLDMASR